MKILSKILRTFSEHFRNVWKCGFIEGSVAKPPKLAKILKNSRKINENLLNFENSHEFLADFDWQRLILTKVKASLMEL